MLYVPMFQAPEGGATFEARTAMDPAFAQTAVLGAVKKIDGRLPVYAVKSLGDQLDDSLVEERLVASLSTTFGLCALVLTGVGLYGLMVYTVNRRTGEIGILDSTRCGTRPDCRHGPRRGITAGCLRRRNRNSRRSGRVASDCKPALRIEAE